MYKWVNKWVKIIEKGVKIKGRILGKTTKKDYKKRSVRIAKEGIAKTRIAKEGVAKATEKNGQNKNNVYQKEDQRAY
ncbi:MAG: hypothetical protein AB1668_01375 [Nanoarchaeota archaeon]